MFPLVFSLIKIHVKGEQALDRHTFKLAGAIFEPNYSAEADHFGVDVSGWHDRLAGMDPQREPSPRLAADRHRHHRKWHVQHDIQPEREHDSRGRHARAGELSGPNHLCDGEGICRHRCVRLKLGIFQRGCAPGWCQCVLQAVAVAGVG